MKKFGLLISFLLVSLSALAQTDQADVDRANWGTVKNLTVFGGYNFNFSNQGENRDKPYHILELGIASSKDHRFHHLANFNYYFSNEFVLNNEQFIYGPKIGAYVGFGGFVLGTEVISYTDFNQSDFRFAPYVGIGAAPFKLSISGHIRMVNRSFTAVNTGSINLSVQLFKLKSEVQ